MESEVKMKDEKFKVGDKVKGYCFGDKVDGIVKTVLPNGYINVTMQNCRWDGYSYPFTHNINPDEWEKRDEQN